MVAAASLIASRSSGGLRAGGARPRRAAVRAVARPRKSTLQRFRRRRRSRPGAPFSSSAATSSRRRGRDDRRAREAHASIVPARRSREGVAGVPKAFRTAPCVSETQGALGVGSTVRSTSRSGGTRPSPAAGGPRAGSALEHGRASTPLAARIDAAIPARAPLSQIVTTGRSLGTSAPRQAGGGRGCCGWRCSRRRARRARARRSARRRPSGVVELVEAHCLHLLGAAAEHVPSSSRKPIERSPRMARSASSRSLPGRRSASASSRKPALVANEVPETGTLSAP